MQNSGVGPCLKNTHFDGRTTMTMRCATYARYSSDLQSPQSIGDQERKCREYAEQQRWSILKEYAYADAELSGTGADRPALQRLLAAVQQRPRPFDILLVDDTSRLSRRQADQSHIIDLLRFAEIRFVSVSQGMDTVNDQADVLLTVQGLFDSMYIKELKKKTHRGLEGRALAGFHTGGRCFGYRSESGPDGVRLVIDEAEAVIVVWIFEWSASGMSLKAIAKKLNAGQVPPPRPRKGKKRATWCPTAVRAMLRNEIYIGKLIWNRTHFVKRPGTNKRVPRERPQNEWLIREHPELRIVSADLWQRVHDRQQLLKEIYKHGGAGLNKASSSPYLLTGFLKCGLCGANLVIVGGKGRLTTKKDYGCSENFNRGACTNGLRIRQDAIERNFFRELQANVLTEDVIDYTIREFTRRIRERQAGVPNEIVGMQARKQEIEQELTRLTAAIAHTGHSSFLLEAIAEREGEFHQITHRLQGAARGGVEQHPGNIHEFVRTRLANLVGLLNTDTALARTELAKHTTEIRMTPEAGADGKLRYMAEGEWDFFGGSDFVMVAGVGFEPTTFGL